ncbi:MAG: histidine ammonia-lyase [Proteobacteria bacterium]|nr:MAG: histidine ammonia-lyase [Pseudomonadota bacterium]
MSFSFGKDRLTTAVLFEQIVNRKLDSHLSDEVTARINEFRKHVELALESGRTIYGINTGFGYLSDVRIESDKLTQLQENLVRSHACGVGDYAAPEVVRGMLFLRVHTFSLGYSGITLQCVKTILSFLEHDILPMIPSQGSVGASGDLAPLSHLALGLLGEGKVLYKGKVMPAKEALELTKIKPLKLSPKEGLSLINGTQYMTTLAALAVEEAKALFISADVITALSLDAIRGTTRAFDERIHKIRPQEGQQASAKRIREMFLDADPIMESHADCSRVQDPYSFRCAPQVHGAAQDTLAYVESKVNIELNSVTDNPLCFEDGDIVSGGNFHGEPMAMAMDFLAIAAAEVGSISERRTEKLTNPNMSGLPAFLMKEGGLNSGYMIPHVVTAALVSENKVLSHPASVDSIPTSADKEDHVSMGPIAAWKARRIIKNLSNILAIELLAACQGLDLLLPLVPNVKLKKVYDAVRGMSPGMEVDRSLHEDIVMVADWLLKGELIKLVNVK